MPMLLLRPGLPGILHVFTGIFENKYIYFLIFYMLAGWSVQYRTLQISSAFFFF